LLLRVVVHAADIQDRDGAWRLLVGVGRLFPRLAKVWVDGGYAGELLHRAQHLLGLVLEVVKRPDDQHGFVLLPRRWVVERSFAWYGRNRRLSKDYEIDPMYSESMVYLASIQLMLRRLAHAPPTASLTT